MKNITIACLLAGIAGISIAGAAQANSEASPVHNCLYGGGAEIAEEEVSVKARFGSPSWELLSGMKKFYGQQKSILDETGPEGFILTVEGEKQKDIGTIEAEKALSQVESDLAESGYDIKLMNIDIEGKIWKNNYAIIEVAEDEIIGEGDEAIRWLYENITTDFGILPPSEAVKGFEFDEDGDFELIFVDDSVVEFSFGELVADGMLSQQYLSCLK